MAATKPWKAIGPWNFTSVGATCPVSTGPVFPILGFRMGAQVRPLQPQSLILRMKYASKLVTWLDVFI